MIRVPERINRSVPPDEEFMIPAEYAWSTGFAQQDPKNKVGLHVGGDADARRHETTAWCSTGFEVADDIDVFSHLSNTYRITGTIAGQSGGHHDRFVFDRLQEHCLLVGAVERFDQNIQLVSSQYLPCIPGLKSLPNLNMKLNYFISLLGHEMVSERNFKVPSHKLFLMGTEIIDGHLAVMDQANAVVRDQLYEMNQMMLERLTMDAN